MKHKFLVLGAVLLVLDQLTKFFARMIPLGRDVVAIPGVLWWTYVQNTGSAFSMLQGQNALLMVVSVAALIALWYYRAQFRTTLEQYALVLIVVGVLGNLLDRIFFGFVVDFINLGWWPVFNVADSCLCVGIGLLVIDEIQNFRR